MQADARRDPSDTKRTKKIHRAGGAFVHLPREPSASAYGPRERLRSTRAPCSVQEGSYWGDTSRSRRVSRKSAHFAVANLSTSPRSVSALVDNRVARVFDYA